MELIFNKKTKKSQNINLFASSTHLIDKKTAEKY